MAVAGDGLGRLHLTGGVDQLVDQLGGQGVLVAEAGRRGFAAERDQQVRFAGSRVADEAIKVFRYDGEKEGLATGLKAVDSLARRVA